MATPASYREIRFTAADGLRLYARDYGDRQAKRLPLLCLGGFARNSKDFDRFARHHAAQRRVVCPDYRGRGQSAYDPDWRHYNPRVLLDDLLQLLSALDLHHVVVVGTSLGAFLGMGLAVARPSALRGLVANDAGPDIDPKALQRISGYLAALGPVADWSAATTAITALMPFLGLKDQAAWRRLAEATYREDADGELRPDWDPHLLKAFAAQSREKHDLWRLFGAVRNLPLLVLRGGRSEILLPRTIERMAEINPGLVSIAVPGVGHAPTLAEPEAETAVDAFLDELDGTQQAEAETARNRQPSAPKSQDHHP